MNIELKLKEIKEKVNKLDKKEAEERLNELYDLTAYYSNFYYNEDSPKISDFEYDMLTQEIRIIEEKFPELKREDAKVNIVGGEASELFSKVNLEVPMQSLQDVFEISEVFSWIEKIEKEYGKRELVVETKIDGLSVSLTYENGDLILASTRGNGLVGENITENIYMIDSIPKKIDYLGKLILRGEVYISKEDFKNIVESQEEKGEKTFSNPRNAAAGSLRQKDKDKIKERNLRIYIFNVQYSDKKFKSHYESLEFVKSLGIDTNKYIKKVTIENVKKDVEKYINEIHQKRKDFTFEIDGAVVKIDDLYLREKLGTTAKTPRWAIAYKYPPEQKETKIKDIEINIGRTGTLTPVAILNPILLDGSRVSKASLHNFEYIKEKDIKIGDTVIVQKAGDIIPEIVKVIEEKRDGTEKELEKPETCPVCKTKVKKEKIAIFCPNNECPSKMQRKIEHFASRDAMNIEGLAEKNIKILLDRKLIKNIPDIYTLTVDDFKTLKKDGKKYAENMYKSINESKTRPLHRLINALGIPEVGVTTSKKLARKYLSLDKIEKAKIEELQEIPDIGEIVAKNIYEYFKDQKNIEIINKLKKLGINTKEDEVKTNDILQNMTFVITGIFNMSRKEIEDLIEINGGKKSSSISKKTDYLIAGEKAGSKLDKAKKLDVNIISLDDFMKMIKN